MLNCSLAIFTFSPTFKLGQTAFAKEKSAQKKNNQWSYICPVWKREICKLGCGRRDGPVVEVELLLVSLDLAGRGCPATTSSLWTPWSPLSSWRGPGGRVGWSSLFVGDKSWNSCAQERMVLVLPPWTRLMWAVTRRRRSFLGGETILLQLQ